MNKLDLIAALVEKEGVRHNDASNIVDTIFDGFTNILRKSGRIEIRGFGSFTVRNHRSHTARNPKTGKKMNVGTKMLPFFKVGKELKEKVNNSL